MHIFPCFSQLPGGSLTSLQQLHATQSGNTHFSLKVPTTPEILTYMFFRCSVLLIFFFPSKVWQESITIHIYFCLFFSFYLHPLLFLNPNLGFRHRRKSSAQSVYMWKKINKFCLKKNDIATQTHTHTTVSSQWIKQKHSFRDFLNCQFSLGCLETNLQPIDNLSFYYTCGRFSSPPHLNTYSAIPGKSASSVSRLNFSGQFEKPPRLL